MAKKYYEKTDKEVYKKLKELLGRLPYFCRSFFRGIEPQTQSRTRLAYAYDLTVFFRFLIDELSTFSGYTIDDLAVEDLDRISSDDIEEYMEYLKYRPSKDGEGDVANKESGIKRKISSLKAFYNYFYSSGKIETNPALKVKLPKIHEKDIIRLEYNEVSKLLDEADTGAGLTKKQQAYHKKTRKRDLALLSLLLGTGMRISECVGIDINDIDFEETAVKIHRKGGKEETVYFSDEVLKAMYDYLEERKHILVEDEDSVDAFFLSLQNKRLSVRSAENLVKKYASIVTPLKHITPHKLRSTYGTNLYRETGDIYLVADVLGHTDVNTTRKHYAAIDENRRRAARKAVKLREA